MGKGKKRITITLNPQMHREACLYAGSMADGPKYESRIDDYFAWLKEQAAEAGFELVVKKLRDGQFYRVEDDDARGEAFMRDARYAFWHWYHGTTPGGDG